jgi:hypothetical protein
MGKRVIAIVIPKKGDNKFMQKEELHYSHIKEPGSYEGSQSAKYSLMLNISLIIR